MGCSCGWSVCIKSRQRKKQWPVTEHLWDLRDKQVWSMEVLPHNLQDFKDLLLTSQGQIPQHIFRGRVESMPQECFGSKRGTNTKSGRVIMLRLIGEWHCFTSAATFNIRQVFVLVCVTVWGDMIFGSGAKLYVTGKNKWINFPYDFQNDNLFKASFC